MELVDYAMPMIKIEKYLRQIHDLCLKEDYLTAADMCPFLAVEARYLGVALVLMQEEKGKRK